jgi:hypothetical protein
MNTSQEASGLSRRRGRYGDGHITDSASGHIMLFTAPSKISSIQILREQRSNPSYISLNMSRRL